jgi:hypothetical protein
MQAISLLETLLQGLPTGKGLLITFCSPNGGQKSWEYLEHVPTRLHRNRLRSWQLEPVSQICRLIAY